MKTQTGKRLHFDGGRVLLAAAAIVQGVQYAQAFLLVHKALGEWALAGGILAGLVVVGAVAYAGNRLPGVKAKAARRWGTVFFVTTLILSPFVLTPVNWYGMDAGLRAGIGGYAWVLAGLVASLPELALGLVALVDRSLISLPAKTGDAVNDAQPQSTTLSNARSDVGGRSKRRSATSATTLYRCECGFTDADRFAVSGHKGKCAIHRQAKAGQPIPVQLPARKEQA